MRAIRAKMHDLCLIFPYPQDANSVKRDRDCRLQSASVFHARRRIFFVFCTLATRKDFAAVMEIFA